MKMHLLAVVALVFVLMQACNKPAAQPVTVPTLMPDAQPKAVAAPVAGGQAVKAAVEKLFEVAKSGDCAAMAPLLALRNTNTPEDWMRGMRYETAAEKVAVDKQCAQLQVIVTDLKTYDFKEFVQEKESEGEWNVWVMDLHYEDGSQEERSFAFLSHGNGYILGDID